MVLHLCVLRLDLTELATKDVDLLMMAITVAAFAVLAPHSLRDRIRSKKSRRLGKRRIQQSLSLSVSRRIDRR